MVNGLGGQLIDRDPRLPEHIAGAGHRIILFDNRDGGESEKIASGKVRLADILAAAENRPFETHHAGSPAHPDISTKRPPGRRLPPPSGAASTRKALHGNSPPCSRAGTGPHAWPPSTSPCSSFTGRRIR